MSLSVVKEALSILDTIANLPTGPITFTNAVFTIFTVISVILSTDGLEGWHKQVNESMGKEVLSAKDEKLLEPITQLLLHIKQARLHENLDLMKGGGDDKKEDKDKKDSGFDINTGYRSLVQTIQNVNARVNQFAVNTGITKFERQFDEEKDIYPFSRLFGVTPVGTALSYVPLPFRTAIFFVHTALDLVRLLFSQSGIDMPIVRQVLSVSLAAMEVLKGDWKKGLLSMAGFFRQSLVLPGFVGKVFLEIFYMISPPLQKDIIYGAFNITKSILIGFLLQLFKITATYESRMTVIKLFKEYAKKEECLDVLLSKAGLPRRQSIQSAFNTEGAHGFMEDRAWHCSEEFKDLIAAAAKNSILRVILQLANIPATEDDMEAQCSRFQAHAQREGYNKWADLLAAEGLMNLLDDGMELEVPDEEQEAEDAAFAKNPNANPELIASFKKLSEQLKALEPALKEALENEKKAEREMLKLIGQVQRQETPPPPPLKLPSMPSLPSFSSMGSSVASAMPTKLPSIGSSAPPVQVNINFPGSKANVPTITGLDKEEKDEQKVEEEEQKANESKIIGRNSIPTQPLEEQPIITAPLPEPGPPQSEPEPPQSEPPQSEPPQSEPEPPKPGPPEPGPPEPEPPEPGPPQSEPPPPEPPPPEPPPPEPPQSKPRPPQPKPVSSQKPIGKRPPWRGGGDE